MTKDIQVTLRLSAEEHERWRAAADAQGLALGTWIRQQCNGMGASKQLVDAVADELEKRAARKKGRQ